MKNFEELVKKHTSSELKDENYFHPLGKYYIANTESYYGYYWYYEANDFIIDIHNFFFLEEFIEYELHSMENIFVLISSFVLSGSGEWFNPYQTIEPFSVFIVDTSNKKNSYLLHKNSRFFTVSIKFKKSFLEKYFPSYSFTNNMENFKNIFFQSRNLIINPISKIAKDILTCQLENKEAEVFFEEKAKEWFNISTHANEEIKRKKKISNEDENLIENVKNYISDHYSSNISQKLLEKIACMCGTKLKATFKNKYQLSITEFIQRKRINMAEQLLLNTDLEIKYISKTVGYTSASRFSKLYKRYKGIYPQEVRKIIQLNSKSKNNPVK